MTLTHVGRRTGDALDLSAAAARADAQEMQAIDGRRFAKEWVEAFNSHDLERILGHYAPTIELISPLYLRFTGGLSDAVHGIDGLRQYFGGALNRYPDLCFTLLEVAAGSRGICIRYRSNLEARIAMECIEFDAGGKAVRALCHYVME